MPVYFNDVDYLPEGLTFDDLKPKSDSEQLQELASQVQLPNFDDPEVLKRYMDYFKVELPQEHEIADGGFAAAYEALNAINESIQRQTLKKDLVYSSIDEFLAKQEMVNKLTNIDNEKILSAYSQLGLIDDADVITIPKGTQFTWKATKNYNGKVYDLYYIKGNKYALIAICTDDVMDVFEEI
jgi:hypothetical protein